MADRLGRVAGGGWAAKSKVASCFVRRGFPHSVVRTTGGLQVTGQRSGTGRPSVAEDGRVRRRCPNQPIVASETYRATFGGALASRELWFWEIWF